MHKTDCADEGCSCGVCLRRSALLSVVTIRTSSYCMTASALLVQAPTSAVGVATLCIGECSISQYWSGVLRAALSPWLMLSGRPIGVSLVIDWQHSGYSRTALHPLCASTGIDGLQQLPAHQHCYLHLEGSQAQADSLKVLLLQQHRQSFLPVCAALRPSSSLAAAGPHLMTTSQVGC